MSSTRIHSSPIPLVSRDGIEVAKKLFKKTYSNKDNWRALPSALSLVEVYQAIRAMGEGFTPGELRQGLKELGIYWQKPPVPRFDGSSSSLSSSSSSSLSSSSSSSSTPRQEPPPSPRSSALESMDSIPEFTLPSIYMQK